MAYVFYDTETTGVETAFDQILQFAAIKTDDELNELTGEYVDAIDDLVVREIGRPIGLSDSLSETEV